MTLFLQTKAIILCFNTIKWEKKYYFDKIMQYLNKITSLIYSPNRILAKHHELPFIHHSYLWSPWKTNILFWIGFLPPPHPLIEVVSYLPCSLEDKDVILQRFLGNFDWCQNACHCYCCCSYWKHKKVSEMWKKDKTNSS